MKNTLPFILCFFYYATYAQEWEWAKSTFNAGSEYVVNSTTDPFGNLYVTGTYEVSTITFGTITLFNHGYCSDIFFIKYDELGNILWAKSFGGTEAD